MSERDIKRLLAIVEAALGREWLDVAEWLREQNQLDEIERALRTNDFRELVAAVEAAARRFAAAMDAGFIRAGQAAADWLDSQPSLSNKIVRFDVKNERAIAAARRNELELVRGLTEEARETIRIALVDGQTSGKNPRSIARDIRDTITLTPSQAQHVLNYRRALEMGDWSNALGRELRDARSDRTIHRLMRDGGSLTEEQIDRMVARYRDNYITFRAETIARTESSRNVHAGLDEAMRQAVDRGDVEADALTKEWIAGPPTKNARERHQAMDGVQVRFDEPFVLPNGVRMKWPGDPAGGAAETANCRCTYALSLLPS